MSQSDLTGCRSLILGCLGPVLSASEKAFFAEQQPYGFILFARNMETPDQVRTLVRDLRASVGRDDAPVLIDQEGGRVQRIRSPHWFDARPFGFFGRLYKEDRDRAREALALTSRLIATDLVDLGISVNCTPCLDLRLPETVDAIGDRAFAPDPEVIIELGELVAEEMRGAGVLPVIKHMPGHGRATVDSHHELPRVSVSLEKLKQTDLVPFQALSHLPWGMTSHIVFEQVDPKWPATQSPTVIKDIIRGEIGFDGLLLTDDLNMNALKGSLAMRAERALQAGVDIVLHCSGKMPEMEEVAPVCPPLTDAAIGRIRGGEKFMANPTSLLDRDGDLAQLNDLLASAE